MLTTTEDQLKDQFTLGGTVTVEKVKKLRDFAFVHYKNREDAEKAQKNFHSKYIFFRHFLHYSAKVIHKI